MIRYTLSDADRTLMQSYRRDVQAAIAVEANKLMGFSNAKPRAIGKNEGGVVVNGCEICIKFDFLCDDWKRTALDNPTPEEIATVKAIEIVAIAGKYDIVLQKEAAPYSGTQLDVTDQVLKNIH